MALEAQSASRMRFTVRVTYGAEWEAALKLLPSKISARDPACLLKALITGQWFLLAVIRRGEVSTVIPSAPHHNGR
jgi:hypothetical protein